MDIKILSKKMTSSPPDTASNQRGISSSKSRHLLSHSIRNSMVSSTNPQIFWKFHPNLVSCFVYEHGGIPHPKIVWLQPQIPKNPFFPSPPLLTQILSSTNLPNLVSNIRHINQNHLKTIYEIRHVNILRK